MKKKKIGRSCRKILAQSVRGFLTPCPKNFRMHRDVGSTRGATRQQRTSKRRNIARQQQQQLPKVLFFRSRLQVLKFHTRRSPFATLCPSSKVSFLTSGREKGLSRPRRYHYIVLLWARPVFVSLWRSLLYALSRTCDCSRFWSLCMYNQNLCEHEWIHICNTYKNIRANARVPVRRASVSHHRIFSPRKKSSSSAVPRDKKRSRGLRESGQTVQR